MKTPADAYREGMNSLIFLQPELNDAASTELGGGAEFFHPAYFETRFRCPNNSEQWPDEFAIVTAYATTGEQWTSEQNLKADRALEAELDAMRSWRHRLTGYSPKTGHAEPGWAAGLSFDAACDLGQRFRQHAIYFVTKDALHVSFCNTRRMLVRVGSFHDRLTDADL